MPNTAEGFYYPDANTNIAPLETVLANMAASSDTVSKQTPRVFANYAAMIAAIPAPTAGRLAVTTQGSGILWQYDGTAAKWVVQNTPTFANTPARDAAIPNPTAGIKCVTGSGATYAQYVYDGASWKLDRTSAYSQPFVYASGFSDWTGGGWSGVGLIVRGGMVYINGYFGAASWAAGATVLTLDAAYRPARTVVGANCEVRTTGVVSVNAAGAVAGNLSASWPQ